MRGITINNEIHTGDDLGLVMTEMILTPPTVQTYSVSVPGRNGDIDLSEFLTGEVAYSNRSLTFKFFADGSRETLLALINKILTYHGRKIEIITDDYPDWYYTGRATVDYTNHGVYVTFQINVNAQPFSYALKPTVYDFAINGHKQITVRNSGISVIPIITVSAETTIQLENGQTLRLSEGTYETSKLKIPQGVTRFVFEGDGNVNLAYREAVI